MRIHYKLLPCEKLHYKTHQFWLSALARCQKGGCRPECSEMSHFLSNTFLKQVENSNVSKYGFRSNMIH